jgi:hypothetical protein
MLEQKIISSTFIKTGRSIAERLPALSAPCLRERVVLDLPVSYFFAEPSMPKSQT